MRIDIFEDRVNRVFHYTLYIPGQPNGRASAPSICGITDFSGFRKSAPFILGDARGKVHFDRGCDSCVNGLAERVVD